MKLNIYYYGEDRSHCGSCWEQSDEDLILIATSLTLDEIKEKHIKYCERLTSAWTRRSIPDFLESLSEESYDFENKKVFPLLKLKVEGTSYCPYICGSIAGEEYDLTCVLDPQKDVPNWKELQKKWDVLENERIAAQKIEKKKEEEKKKKKNKLAKIKKKKLAEKKEFERYLKLKTKWENKKVMS